MNTQPRLKTSTALFLVMTAGLAGCSSGGGGSKTTISTTNTTPPVTTTTTTPLVTGQVANEVGTGLGGVGVLVSDVGTTLTKVPVVGAAGGLVVHTGDAVSSITDGVTNGLGSLGTDKNSLGITVAGVTNGVSDVGKGVSSLGTGVSGLVDNTPISQIPLVGGVVGKVTDTTGGLVNKVGTTVTMLGNTLTTNVTSGQLGKATGGLNDKVVVPVISLVENVTGKVGTTTGLGKPVDGLLKQVGGVVGGAR